MNRKVATVLLAGLVVTGCSIADPDSSQIVLHYTGGPLSSQNFDYCTAAGIRSTGGAADYNFYYPAGQRTYTFSDRPGADAPPIRVSTRNQTELVVRGTITFTLNPSCEPYTDATGKEWPGGKLQKFHDTIGRQNNAFATTGGELPPPGWDVVLNLYVGGPAERAMDNAGLGFDWQALYSDAVSKDQWTKSVEERLPMLISDQAGDDLFQINNIQLDKPDVPDGLRVELEANQAAGLRQATAETDQRAAESFPGGLPAYLDYQAQQAVNKAIADGRVNPLIVPQGSSVIVAPGGVR